MDKQDRGKAEVEKLKIFGKLLADDPEFGKIFRCNLDGCPEINPNKAMNCVYAFFNAITDASRPGNAQNGVKSFQIGLRPLDRRIGLTGRERPSLAYLNWLGVLADQMENASPLHPPAVCGNDPARDQDHRVPQQAHPRGRIIGDRRPGYS